MLTYSYRPSSSRHPTPRFALAGHVFGAPSPSLRPVLMKTHRRPVPCVCDSGTCQSRSRADTGGIPRCCNGAGDLSISGDTSVSAPPPAAAAASAGRRRARQKDSRRPALISPKLRGMAYLGGGTRAGMARAECQNPLQRLRLVVVIGISPWGMDPSDSEREGEIR